MIRPSVPARAGRVARSYCTLVTALLLTLSCDGAFTSTGGETHFLTACDPTSKCGDGLACVCGTCARICAEVSECVDLPLAECQAPAQGAACQEATGQALCDVSCSSHADCSALSSDHFCEAGRCRAGSNANLTGGASPPDAVPQDAGNTMEGCAPAEIAADEVLVIGDSFFGASHQITASLEAQARSLGILSEGEAFQDESSARANALALGGNGLLDQYLAAASEAEVEVVIMNGGGTDVLIGSCAEPTSDCPVLRAARAAARELLSRMAADGVGHVVYAFYPDPVDADLRAEMDALRPLIEGVCQESPVPCHWLDLRETFAGNYDEYIQPDGINPTREGAQATALEIWQLLQRECIVPR